MDRWALRGDPSGDHVPPAPRLPAPLTYSLFAFPAEDNFAGEPRRRRAARTHGLVGVGVGVTLNQSRKDTVGVVVPWP